MDLTTTYLGLKLKNPLVPSASPLTRSLDSAKELEDAEAAAVVLFSLFEEEIIEEERELQKLLEFQTLGHTEAGSYLPTHYEPKTRQECYLEHIHALKQSLDIPVIGSLNCITDGGWIAHAKEIEEAGADALELNIYHIPTRIERTSTKIEEFYLSIVNRLALAVDIPIAVKLSFQFTTPLNFVRNLQNNGANGAVLFNRFYQPDLDLETMQLNHKLYLSQPYESLLRIHWIALLKGQVELSLAATGGVHGTDEVIKLLLVGADITQMASCLLINGAKHITATLDGLKDWMDRNEYHSVEQLKGSFSQLKAPDPWVFERTNYLEMLSKKYKSHIKKP